MIGKLRIFFGNEQDKIKPAYNIKMLVRRAILATLEFEDYRQNVEVSVTFTDNEGIKIINSQYRKIDKETDVLSFPMLNEGEYSFGEVTSLGDIVLSLEKAREQGELYGHGFEREIAFLCIHSTLHLLGYDHETGEEDEKDMRQRQSAIAEIMGLGVK